MANPQQDDLVLRATKWNLRKAVPREYMSVELKKEITRSLRTDSRLEAECRKDAVWDSFVVRWELLLAGRSDDASAAFEATERLLKSKNLRYVPIEDLLVAPTAAILARVGQISSIGNEPCPVEAAAVLGVVERPLIMLGEALELFWPMVKDKTKGKSEDQMRRWKNPIKKAINNFIKVVGDKLTCSPLSPLI